MVSASSFTTKSRQLSFILLLVFGGSVVILGLLVLAVGLALTHNDTFHDTIGLKEQVETRVDYVQYWIGIPYIITGVSVACSAINLQRVSLTVCTVLLSLVCVVLSLAGLVVDGPDWVVWKDFRASQRYWEGQDGYACASAADMCTCSGGALSSLFIFNFTDCETLAKLASIYGVLIGCFVFALVMLLASVFIIVYIVTSKREKARREGRTYQETTKVVEARFPEPVFQNMVRDNTNQGYEYGDPVPVEEPAQPVQYREYRHQEADSVSQQNIDASSIGEQDGVVMMDPGHFRLGDDDIY